MQEPIVFLDMLRKKSRVAGCFADTWPIHYSVNSVLLCLFMYICIMYIMCV